MKRTKEDAEQTHRELLDAAVRIFARQGYAATKLTDIADEAGVTRGAIYHHFGNKKELFNALHKEKMNPYFVLFEETMASDLSSLQKIRTILGEVIKKAQTDSIFADQQRFDAFRDIEFGDDEEIRCEIRERGELFFNQLSRTMSEGVASGELREDLNPDMAAINTIAYLKGLMSLLLIEKNILMITESTDELIEQALKGII